ncbi:MAG TPA: aminotransferase class V-fold PLP-dependent enzyme, partial [Turneriella sp.]|nr:aminotransferase class V-fold PLP-dependent enzyme [Turneriella sp.]
PVDSDGNYNAPPHFLDDLSSRYSIRVVSLSLQSNVTGILHDTRAYRDFAKATGAAFVVDGAQAVVHAPHAVGELNADFVAYSAHKLFGPTGIGALVADKSVLDACDVYQGGGGMINLVEHDKSTYLDAPGKYEAGTQAIGE